MDKKNLLLATLASAIIGILVIPTISNLPLPAAIGNFGTGSVAIVFALLVFLGYLTAEFIGRWVALFKQLGRFAIVGVLNTVVDFAVFNVLINAFASSGSGANIAKGISFVVAVINSYYWNKYWTFQANQKTKNEFLEFVIVSVVGFGLNVLTFHIVGNVIGPLGDIDPKTWANFGALCGTLVGLAWNFLGYKLFVFKKHS